MHFSITWANPLHDEGGKFSVGGLVKFRVPCAVNMISDIFI